MVKPRTTFLEKAQFKKNILIVIFKISYLTNGLHWNFNIVLRCLIFMLYFGIQRMDAHPKINNDCYEKTEN